MVRFTMAALATAILVLHLNVACAQQYTKLKFSDFTKETQTRILDFKAKAAKYGEGCSPQLTELGYAVLKQLGADAVCGASIYATAGSGGAAFQAAVLGCGVAVPSTLYDTYSAHKEWKTCEEMVSVKKKFKKYCEDKNIFAFVYKDMLICVAEGHGYPLLMLDMKTDAPTAKVLVTE